MILPKILVIGLSNKCNNNCSYCPHSNPVWKAEHGEDMMSIKIAKIILKQLNELNFTGLISFSGKGEPFLNKHIFSIIKLFKNYNTQLITNGNNIILNDIIKLESIGLKKLILSTIKINYISKTMKVESKLDKIPIFNNRGGIINIDSDAGKCCYLPSLKLEIEPNGDFCYCPNSFVHYKKEYNIFNCSIKEFWEEKINLFRYNAGLNRSNDLCKTCNCNGELSGKEEFNNIYKERII